jgi:hypothetical protein
MFFTLYQKAERVSFLKMIQKSNGQNKTKKHPPSAA